MYTTEEEYLVSQQRVQDIDVKIELLNKNFQILEVIDGNAGLDSVLNISNSTEIRRTLSLTLFVTDSSFKISEDSKIWFNKYVRVTISVKNILTGEYVPTNLGTYVITNPTQAYSSITNTLTIECLDPMCLLNGYMDGNLNGIAYLLKAGENVSTAITAVLELAGVTEYTVLPLDLTIPNDITISGNSTYYDILYQLATIMPYYQIYFNINGVFVFSEIPYNSNVTIVADDDLFKNKVINWSKVYAFSDIKNSVTVIGGTHEITHYERFPTYFENGNYFNLEISSITDFYDYMKIGFVSGVDVTNPKVSINFGTTFDIVSSNGEDVELVKEGYYVISYREDDGNFQFYGELTPAYTAQDTDENSEFCIDKIGEISLVLQGNEYENIYTDNLAKERAIWELYTHTRMKETVSVSIIPVFWLNEVNEVIECTLPNIYSENTYQYILNSISISFNPSISQTINMSKYYTFYIE